jgi:hypothetical protein
MASADMDMVDSTFDLFGMTESPNAETPQQQAPEFFVNVGIDYGTTTSSIYFGLVRGLATSLHHINLAQGLVFDEDTDRMPTIIAALKKENTQGYNVVELVFGTRPAEAALINDPSVLLVQNVMKLTYVSSKGGAWDVVHN